MNQSYTGTDTYVYQILVLARSRWPPKVFCLPQSLKLLQKLCRNKLLGVGCSLAPKVPVSGRMHMQERVAVQDTCR